MEEMKFVTMTITPGMARAFLDGMTPFNRDLDRYTVAKYVKDMLSGDWEECTGETIKFDSSGILLDGQHRLQAVINSGVTLTFAVAYGCKRPELMDIGKTRTPKNAVEMMGYANAGVLAPLAGLAFRYERTLEAKRFLRSGSVSRPQLLKRIYDDPAIHATVSKFADIELRRMFKDLVSTTHVALIHYKGSNTSPEKANEFVDKLGSGIGLEEGGPILALREKIIRNRKETKKIDNLNMLAMMIKAWLAYEDGRQMKNLQFRDTETFPLFLCDQ